MGHVAALELSGARRRELEPRGHVAVPELSCARRREMGATGHVAVPELSWALVAGAGAMRHVAVPELSCARRREPGPWGTWQPRSYRGPWWWELEPRGTWRLRSCPVLGDGSRGTRGMCARLVFRLDLELVRRGIRSSGFRQWPPGPPRERL
jgi:hypothetical protein